MPAAKTLIVKLTDGTPAGDGPELIRAVLGARARRVEPLFPDAEADLATLFNVTLGASASPDRAIAALEQDPHVQYAHTPRGRKPA